ncbi:MAG: DUF2281 domain-containing protein [Candidatus Aminicenantes bacterium]|nr:DUF2281 domain-containing protein [Candidatus Aminicenantes bacterium]NIM77842.1 DUF2281 domain-containing protein [Candidatus Aminicenantes bacterium]NIN17154.1 DUF2281 domain-containing protein [Candidatus Aminicenantes bacterium]NIN41047.1 DUF2281 domain-containing protein [Candidatus Aminicenantes bacterium]NIN83852.1 DUF2281 domain-containing protein [Candidatus Aminicenantes bacterium]
MQPETVTIDKIKSKLAEVPEDKLPEIYDFVEFIVDKAKLKQPKKKKIVKLGGIWKGLGFEKINDLEGEVRKIRKQSHQQFSEKIQESSSIDAIWS